MDRTESKAAIAGHPLHPAVVSFPIAFLVGAAVTDLVHWQTGDLFWGQASYSLLLAGLVTGALAALLGLIEFVSIARVRRLPAGWIHLIGNVAALVLALGNLMVRRADPRGTLVPGGLVLSFLTAGLLMVTGWLGGELSYRHKIGVIDE